MANRKEAGESVRKAYQIEFPDKLKEGALLDKLDLDGFLGLASTQVFAMNEIMNFVMVEVNPTFVSEYEDIVDAPITEKLVGISMVRPVMRTVKMTLVEGEAKFSDLLDIVADTSPDGPSDEKR